MFEAALAVAAPNQAAVVRTQLGGLLLSLRRFAEAAEAYDGLVVPGAPDSLTERYIQALYHAKRERDALEFIEKLRAVSRPTDGVLEIEARLRAAAGDLQLAIDVVLELVGRHPETASHRVHLAFLLERSGKVVQAREMVERISIDSILNDADALALVAQLRVSLGLGGELPFVHRARSAAFEDPEVHCRYIWYYLGRSQADDLDQEYEQVRPGTSVLAHAEDDASIELEWTVVERPPARRDIGEVLPTSTEGRQLMGRRRGEHVAMKATALGERRYRITAIRSQYAGAFADSIQNFERRFPEHPGITAFKASDDSFARLAAQGERWGRVVEQVLQLYEHGRLPLKVCAMLLDRSSASLWMELVSSPSRKLLASKGQPYAGPEVGAEAVLDVTSVLAVVHLNLRETILSRFSKVYVSPAVRDQLSRMLVMDYRDVVVTPNGESGVLTNLASREQQRALLMRAMDFIDGSCSPITSRSLLAGPDDPLRGIRSRAEPASVASLLAAAEHGCVLSVDDMGLGHIAWVFTRVPSISSEELIDWGGKSGTLSAERCREAKRGLLRMNYYSLALNVGLVSWLVALDDAEARRDVVRVLDRLSGVHGGDLDLAVEFVAELLRTLCHMGSEKHRIEFVLDAAIRALSESRLAPRVLRKLRHAIGVQLARWPNTASALVRTVDLWRDIFYAVRPGLN